MSEESSAIGDGVEQNTSSEMQQTTPVADAERSLRPTQESGLLPCPFCGGEAIVSEDRGEGDSETGEPPWIAIHVLCGNDACPVQPGIYGEESEEIATEKWSSRYSQRSEGWRDIAQVAKVIPVGHSYSVAIGSIGIKLLATLKDAQEVCDAINRNIAAELVNSEKEPPETRCTKVYCYLPSGHKEPCLYAKEIKV